MKTIGKAINRVDGIKKVTGQARYAAEFEMDNMHFGYIVNSTITKGTIENINAEKAKAIDGVKEVFTHLNLPEYLKSNSDFTDPLAPPGEPFRPLHDNKIVYNGQPIAMVVADAFETARYAASLLEINYTEDKDFITDLGDDLRKAITKDVDDPPKDRGDAGGSYEKAEVRLDLEYTQPRLYHNPMEPHASIVSWDEHRQKFTVYDKIQGVASTQIYLAGVFSLDADRIKVSAPFIGGAFGSGLRPQYQLFFAALASKELKVPVKVVMTRKQMFSFGHRPACIQHIKLGAYKNGKLRSIDHMAYGETSTWEKFSEAVVDWSGLMYRCENVSMAYKLVELDNYTSLDTRGPGGTTGLFALETAMDELAVELDMDPLELRLLNYADRDQNEEKPFSSKELKACYNRAAEAFGWDKRHTKPGSMQEANELVGYGMATGCWEAMQKEAAAKAVLDKSGHLTVSSATADIGTGTYTVMTQIASDCLGIDMDRITFKLGDTDLPESPIEGGSWTVSSVGSAVKKVCMQLKKQLLQLAQEYGEGIDASYDRDMLTVNDGKLHLKNKSLDLDDLLTKAHLEKVEANVNCEPAEDRDKYSYYAHSCVMVEVRIDKDLGMITVPRVVSAVAGGKIINPKTAESQILGGIVWGLGMALEEEGMMDNRMGRIMNANLAEYHIPVQADIRDCRVIFVDEEDEHVNALGAKGLGEIGLIGVAAAVGNAIYNATGKRLRNLPFQLDRLID